MTFRVLIIDDDEKLNQLLTDYLGKMGFTIACLKAFWRCFLPVSSSCSMWATNCDPLWHAWKLHLNSFRKIHPVKFTHRCAGNGADGNGDFRNCPAEKWTWSIKSRKNGFGQTDSGIVFGFYKDMLRGFVLKVLLKRAKLSLTQTVLKNLLANALKIQMRKMLRLKFA